MLDGVHVAAALHDIARDAAESALHYDSSLAVPQQILARIYLTEKNYQGARQLLEKIVKKSPGDKNLWLDLALCYEKTNDYQMLAEADKTIMSLDKHDVASRVRYAKYAMCSSVRDCLRRRTPEPCRAQVRERRAMGPKPD